MFERIVTKLLNIPLDFMTGVMGIPFPIAVGINSVVLGVSLIALVTYIFARIIL